MAMITVSPSPTAVTTPSALTLATAGLLLIQVSTGAVWPAAFAVSRWLAPMDCNNIVLLLTVTRPISDVTVTVHRSTCPAVVNALITALPEPTAVTVPLLLTVATARLLVVHWRTYTKAPLVCCRVSRRVGLGTFSVMVRAASVWLSTGWLAVPFFTVMVQAAFSPRSLQAVMTAVPSARPVTLPVPSTVAAAGSLEVQMRKKYSSGACTLR